MRDIHIVHDKVGSYASWIGDGKHKLAANYLTGKATPNYPMPAIRYDVEIYPDRIILVRKGVYWMFQYLASTIPTKILNRWAE